MPKKLKKPSMALRRHYAPIIELATKLIVNSPSKLERDKRASLSITYLIDWERGNFPKGLLVRKTETTKTYKYDCAKLLKWFHDNLYIDYNASMLYARRLPVMMMLAQSEQDLDRMLNKVELKEI